MSRRSLSHSLLVAALSTALLVPTSAAHAAQPPPEPHPDYTVIGVLSLCGTFRLGNVTIASSGMLRVATVADPSVSVPSRSGEPPQPNCPPGSEGALTILASRIINHGTIDATGTQSEALQPEAGPGAVYTGDPPTGNGGGGHHGPGGDGSTGAGGDGYTVPAEATRPVTERGMPGAGNQPGAGGGAVVLHADGDLVSTGVIRADGLVGGSDTRGACGVPDDPGTPSVDESILFTGFHAPGGGGAGGGVVLEAHRLQLTGSISAKGGRGGAGRAGGGGGGAGGVVKLIAPVQVLAGFDVDVQGGPAGGGNCPSGNPPGSSTEPGHPGAPGLRVDVADPTGTAYAPETFWNRGSVRVPVDAAGSYSSSTPSGFTVHVCGIRSNSPAPPSVPSTNSAGNPCGDGAATLASKTFAVFEVRHTDAEGFVDVPLPGSGNDGYWGVWAAVVRGPAVSPPPDAVQASFGIDNTAPLLTIHSPPAGFVTAGSTVLLDFDRSDPSASGQPSGIAATECRNELPGPTAYAPCEPGQDFALTPGYGPKRIGVRVTDVAGNETLRTVEGTVANSAPVIAADRPSEKVNEGGTATMTGTVADAEPFTLSASRGTVEPGPGGTWTWHQQTTDGPADEGQVTVTATDSLGASSSATFTLVVTNLPPQVSITTPDPGAGFEVGQQVSLSGAFDDPGTGDTHTATVDWGDGQSSPATVVGAGGAGTLSAGHAYAAAGTYSIEVRVHDDDGAVGSSTRTVVVERVATSLTADPALLHATPLVVHLFDLSARLTRADTGAPIPGQTVQMTLPRPGGGTAVVCSAVTDANGRATCSGSARAVSVVLNNGYQARYAGSAAYDPATARGSLVTLRVP